MNRIPLLYEENHLIPIRGPVNIDQVVSVHREDLVLIEWGLSHFKTKYDSLLGTLSHCKPIVQWDIEQGKIFATY